MVIFHSYVKLPEGNHQSNLAGKSPNDMDVEFAGKKIAISLVDFLFSHV